MCKAGGRDARNTKFSTSTQTFKWNCIHVRGPVSRGLYYSLGAGRSVDRILVGGEFSTTVQTGSRAH